MPIVIKDALYLSLHCVQCTPLKSKLNMSCCNKILKHLTLTKWEWLYSKLLPSPICEEKVNEASLQNTVNAPSTWLCLLLHIKVVNQGGKTCVEIWTSCNAYICHGKDCKAAAATAYALHLLPLLFLPFQLLLLARLMVIGCRPRPPDGRQAAILETLAERFLKMLHQQRFSAPWTWLSTQLYK